MTSKTFLEPPIHSDRVYMFLNSPIIKDHCFAFKRIFNVISGISCLFFACGPSAIIRLIVSIIVNSVYAVIAAWPWPHIGYKVFKLTPSFANLYPTSKMCRILWMINCAPYKHSSPYFVFSRMAHPMSFLFYSISRCSHFFPYASTRKTLSISNILRLKNFLISTITLAQIPSLPRYGRRGFRNNRKTAVFISNHFNLFAHVIHTTS